MKVWIDLANSPHPLLFAPVAREIERRGHEVAITVRDNAQTAELARERFGETETIGGPTPKRRPAKARVLAERVVALRSWARRARPDVALSHNSYAQIVAARSAGVRTVTAMDFEHQPANHVAFRLAHVVLLPEAVPQDVVARQGARGAKVIRYPGLKEELYLGDFEPNDAVLAEVGVERDGGGAVVVVRTPPSRAIYHQFQNHSFADVLRLLGEQEHVKVVALARHPEDRELIAALRLPNCVTPERAVDTRSLLFRADLVVGAGGTMTREAALLGVPTFSLFAGEQPAVDRALERSGLLRRLTDPAEVLPVRARADHAVALDDLRRRGEALVKLFADATVGA